MRVQSPKKPIFMKVRDFERDFFQLYAESDANRFKKEIIFFVWPHLHGKNEEMRDAGRYMIDSTFLKKGTGTSNRPWWVLQEKCISKIRQYDYSFTLKKEEKEMKNEKIPTFMGKYSRWSSANRPFLLYIGQPSLFFSL